jgi:VanZ family protein
MLAFRSTIERPLMPPPRNPWESNSTIAAGCTRAVSRTWHQRAALAPALRQASFLSHISPMRTPRVALRVTAWVCIGALAVASWTPGQEMVRTGFNTRLEHVAAYLIAGIAVISAYPGRPIWTIAAILCAYAGVLELGQLFIPGRHAAILDWLGSSSGVLCACLTVYFFRKRHHMYVNH